MDGVDVGLAEVGAGGGDGGNHRGVVVIAGLLVGIVAAFWLTRLVAGLLFEIDVRDPWTFALVPALLTAVALLACWLPALRAAHVDPLLALRHE